MSIASEITRLQTAKADIKAAIEGKGVTVPSAATLDDYADYVDAISGGGSGGNPDEWQRPSDWPDYSKVTLEDNQVYLTYDLSIWPEGSSRNIVSFVYTSTGGTKTLEIGTLVNGVFTASVTRSDTTASDSIKVDLPTDIGNYPVARFTSPNAITRFCPEVDTLNPLIEVYGKSSGITQIGTSLALKCGGVFTRSYTMFGNVAPTTMRYTFLNMYSLENINIPNFDASNCTTFEYAFDSCRSLKYLTPLHVASVCTKTNQMFNNCGALTEVDMSDWNLSGVTNMSKMFQNSTIRKIDFKNKALTALTNFNNFAGGAMSLSEVDFSGLTTGSAITDIGLAFYANSLEVLDLRNMDMSSVTNTSQISYNAKLMKVWFPSTLKKISSNSFKNNNDLTEVHIEATTVPTLENINAFTNSLNKVLPNLIVYVPYSSDHSVLNAYKAATNWSTMADHIQEEPQD